VAELTVADYEEMDRWHTDVIKQMKILASNQVTTHDMIVKRFEKLEERLEQAHKADVAIIGFMQEINHFMNDTVNILANGITPDGTDTVSKIQEIAGTVRKIDANNQEAYRNINDRFDRLGVRWNEIAQFMSEFVAAVEVVESQEKDEGFGIEREVMDDVLSSANRLISIVQDLTKVVAADDTSPSTKKRKKK
jgi:hypothetical protein